MSNPTNILIVDDDAQLAFGVCCRLESEGYRTSTACDGAAGVAAAIANQPDVILMDVMMPKVDGMAALGRLRVDPRTRHMPVIMLSASLSDERKALDAGARYFLRKPYRHDELFAAVEQVTCNATALA